MGDKTLINQRMDAKDWAMLLLLSFLWGGSFFLIGVNRWRAAALNNSDAAGWYRGDRPLGCFAYQGL